MNSRIAIHTAIVLATIFALALACVFREALLIFVLSLVVSAALRPAIEFFARRMSPHFATVVTYALFLSTLAALALGLGERLVANLGQAGDDLMNSYDYMTQEWPQGTWLERRIVTELPPKDKIFANVAAESGLKTLQTVAGVTFSAASIFIDGVLVIILSVYWSLDRVRFERLWLSLLSAPKRTVSRDIWRTLESEIGSYFRSELLQCLLAGILLAAGYWLLGQRYPVLLAFICALAWTLPWVGVVIAVLAVLVLSLPALVQAGTPAVGMTAAALAYTCTVLLLLEFAVEPRLFARQRLNMVLVAAVSLCLAYAFGLFGLLLGLPVSVVLQVIGGQLLRQRVDTRMGEEPAGHTADLSDRLAALRESLGKLPSPSPELLSLVQRLDELLTKVHGTCPVPP